MKKLLTFLVLSTAALCCKLALAGIVSINMTDPGGTFDLAPGENAGAVPSANWNNVPFTPNQDGPTVIDQQFFDSGGEAAPLGLTYRAWDGRNSDSVVGNDPNARLLKGGGPSPFNSSGESHPYAAIELTGCNASVGAVYDVYIYINEGIGFTSGSYGTIYLSGAGTFGSGAPPSGSSTAGLVSYRTLNSEFTGAGGVPVYSAARGLVRSSTIRAGNYVRIERMTLDTLTITPWMLNDRSDFHGVGITGIQLVQVSSEGCDNGLDDDGDGDVDCDDLDCPACPEICDNGVDDDRDNVIDCEDLDCPACPEICDNGIDDDRDNDIDCEDLDCPACPEICNNRVDDDRDGDIDCRDLDCPACPEWCDNGIDDDRDGIVDCLDSDCPACPEICANGIDDDGDNDVDCDDSDCASTTACRELCENGIDDDGDNDVDCDDSDCLMETACLEPFLRGDSNGDAMVNISDAAFTLQHLFLSGNEPGCKIAADANGDGRVNISDAAFTLNHLFLGGTPMPPPYPGCGTDPEDEVLGCASAPTDCQ